ncbi:hypothetical protein FHX44_111654 [Pseudonocardia hierapolitana]|uniref:Uncharacterized protein n=1 Tax=Pseudonocardia hierapolitana TaxID=1128676 RepID=A0A561SLN2_9PSEU|nr:hypothetical protein FHX44_111654 [Pseudonocardia hierapolitana]
MRPVAHADGAVRPEVSPRRKRREMSATGKALVLPYAALYTVRDGLIVSAGNYWDGLEALDQLRQTPT